MTFPVHFNLFGFAIPAHAAFELLAYTLGFQLYLRRRNRFPRAATDFEVNLWIVVGCVLGAAVGSKGLAWLESPLDYWNARDNLLALLGGKTLVGGLLGGWIGVEIAKRHHGVRHSTGDAFVLPLIVGMCIGRIGCFLTGLPDKTYGVHTSVPWAVDFGDGPRHPTQLYEIAFLLLLGTWLWQYNRLHPANGRLFRWFMLGYLGFRFAVEFIKPSYAPYLGLSAIQIACLLGIFFTSRGLFARADQPSSLQPVSSVGGQI